MTDQTREALPHPRQEFELALGEDKALRDLSPTCIRAIRNHLPFDAPKNGDPEPATQQADAVVRAIVAECRERMKHGENYVRPESGMFWFTIAPHHLNALLRAVEAPGSTASEDDIEAEYLRGYDTGWRDGYNVSVRSAPPITSQGEGGSYLCAYCEGAYDRRESCAGAFCSDACEESFRLRLLREAEGTPPDWKAAALLKDRTRRAIRERHHARESVAALAADYGVPVEFVEALVAWQMGGDDLTPDARDWQYERIAPSLTPNPEGIKPIESVSAEDYKQRFQEFRGYWPDDCIQRAFVDGAAWWEWTKTGATLWSSERDRAEAEAVNRYGEPAAKPRDVL